jgi:hypothetical protein
MIATATDPLVCPAPRPACCGLCEGEGIRTDDDFGEMPCPGCDGTGAGGWLPPCEFLLPRTRTHKHRHVRFDPNAGRLRLTRGRTVTDYVVMEFPTGGGFGRGFALEKQSDPRSDGVKAVYQLQCGTGGTAPSCDCAGDAYAASAKANGRAYDEGREVFPTLGCIHLDSVTALVRAGWFDRVAKAA